LWLLPRDRFGEFVLDVREPLAIGSVELADGSRHPGFVCEPIALTGAPDITRYGGWIAYRAAASRA
jgi:allophanate hydrolase